MLAADQKEMGALKDAFDPVSTMPDMDKIQLAHKSIAMTAAAGELEEEVPSAQELKALKERHGPAMPLPSFTGLGSMRILRLCIRSPTA